MTIHKVNNLVVDCFVEETDKDIVMMNIGVASSKCQQVKLLKEFLSRFRSLTQERQLVLGVGFLVGILESFFALLPEISEWEDLTQ